jgi:hypothetical protein
MSRQLSPRPCECTKARRVREQLTCAACGVHASGSLTTSTTTTAAGTTLKARHPHPCCASKHWQALGQPPPPLKSLNCLPPSPRLSLSLSLTHSASRANPPRSPQTTRPVMCKRAVLPSEAKAGERRAVLVLDDVDSYTCVTVLLFRSGLRGICGIDAQVLPPALSSAASAVGRGGQYTKRRFAVHEQAAVQAFKHTYVRTQRMARTRHTQRCGVLSSSARVWLSSTARTASH